MMNQTIQQTTQKFIDLLPENKQYYRIDELRSWGFPSFIVERIQVELERNLAESMILPKTDWANTQSDAVLDAWQQFVQAIRAEARLPASFAKAVIETAVADTLDMLIEPRKNIPDVIFGSNEELDYEQLCDRIKAVVVYRHFSTLMPRYMQKKELDVLTRDRCDQIIRRADERLTSNYSPLNWAQTLDPLFRLLDEQVDPSMLRLFFEDKGREKIAEVFDRKEASMSRAEFIEVLSSPDWAESQADSVEREQEKKSAEASYDLKRAKYGTSEKTIRTEEIGFERQEGQKNERRKEKRFDEPEQGVREEKAVEDDTFMDPQVYADAESSSQSESEDKSQPEGDDNGFADLAASEPDPQEEDVQTLNSAFGWEEGPIAFESEEEVEEETEDEASAVSPVWEEPAGDDVEVKGAEEGEREDKPIWMNFMSEEEKAALESEEEKPIAGRTVKEQESNQEVEADSDMDVDVEKDFDDYGEELFIDLRGDDPTEREVSRLKEQLAGGRRRFVEDIFGGSERAYEEALEEIAMLSNWQGASKYIQKEIFQRNLVDMYSESAIDFTDRLHNYFSKKED